MSNVLAGLKARTVALLRGEPIAEIVPPGTAAAVSISVIDNAVQAAADEPEDAGAPAPEGDPADNADPAGDPPADPPAAPVAEPAPDAAAVRAEAAAAERARFGAVLADAEYKGRETLAHSLLTSTDLTAEQIVANLKAAPKAQTAGVAAMLGHENPDLGAGGDAGGNTQARVRAGWDNVIAAMNRPIAGSN